MQLDFQNSNQSQKKYFWILWLMAIFAYLYFNINIHMHESYVYAGSSEGFFDIIEGSLGSSPWLLNYGKFGIYHPDHPLLNLLGSSIKNLLFLINIQTNVLQNLVLINTLAGIGGVVVFYKILSLFSSEKIFITIFALILMFSDLYWFGSKSGEGYVSGQCFNLLSTYFAFKYIKAPKLSSLIKYSLFFGLSISFHALYFIMLIPHLFLFSQSPFLFKSKNLLKISSIIFLVISVFGMAFYILPLYFHVGAHSLSEMVNIITYYRDEFGVWNNSVHGFNDLLVNHFLIPFCSGIFHLLLSTIDGFSAISIILRFFLLSLSLLAFHWSLKNLRLEISYILVWFFSYFVFIVYICAEPYDITYWLFLMPAFIFILFYYLNSLNNKIAYAALILMCFVTINFNNDIYPKFSASENDYFFTKKIIKESQDTSKLAIVIYDSFAETSYLNYYGTIWSIKNNPYFKNKEIEIIIDENQLQEKIKKLTINGEKLLVLRNVPFKASILDRLNSQILTLDYHLVKDTKLRHFYNPKLDKTSEFQHPNIWYDRGPVNQSWVFHLSLYEK